MVWVPRFVAFLVVLLIGYFVARALRDLTVKGLRRTRFDSVIERVGIRETLERSGYDAAGIVALLVYYGVWLFTLEIAFGVFGPNAISDVLNRMIAFLPNIFVALAIIVVAGFIGSAVKQIVQAALGGLSYGRYLANAASIGIVVVGVFAALSQLNIAPMIVNGLFYALLAIVTGSAIVAIGGGGIRPMRAQWEKALNRVEQEAPRLRMEMGGAAPRTRPWAPPVQSAGLATQAEMNLLLQTTEPLSPEELDQYGEEPYRRTA